MKTMLLSAAAAGLLALIQSVHALPTINPRAPGVSVACRKTGASSYTINALWPELKPDYSITVKAVVDGQITDAYKKELKAPYDDIIVDYTVNADKTANAQVKWIDSKILQQQGANAVPQGPETFKMAGAPSSLQIWVTANGQAAVSGSINIPDQCT